MSKRKRESIKRERSCASVATEKRERRIWSLSRIVIVIKRIKELLKLIIAEEIKIKVNEKVEIRINREGDISVETKGYIDIKSGLLFLNCEESVLKEIAIKELKNAETSEIICGHSEMPMQMPERTTVLTGGGTTKE